MPTLFQKCDHKGSSLQHTHGAAPQPCIVGAGLPPTLATLAGFPPTLATLAGLPPALFLWRDFLPPCYFTEPVASSREQPRCLDTPRSQERHRGAAHRASQRTWQCCTHTSRVQRSAGCWATDPP